MASFARGRRGLGIGQLQHTSIPKVGPRLPLVFAVFGIERQIHQAPRGNSCFHIQRSGTKSSSSNGHRHLRRASVEFLEQIDLVPIALEVHRLLAVAPFDPNWVVFVRGSFELEENPNTNHLANGRLWHSLNTDLIAIRASRAVISSGEVFESIALL